MSASDTWHHYGIVQGVASSKKASTSVSNSVRRGYHPPLAAATRPLAAPLSACAAAEPAASALACSALAAASGAGLLELSAVVPKKQCPRRRVVQGRRRLIPTPNAAATAPVVVATLPLAAPSPPSPLLSPPPSPLPPPSPPPPVPGSLDQSVVVPKKVGTPVCLLHLLELWANSPPRYARRSGLAKGPYSRRSCQRAEAPMRTNKPYVPAELGCLGTVSAKDACCSCCW